MARLSTKMLIGISRGDDEDPGQGDHDRRAADGERHARGDQRAEHEHSASAASGSEITSERCRSVSVTSWTSP